MTPLGLPSLKENTVNPRLQRLSILLREAGLDALALNPGPTLTYLTGLHFHLMERPVVGLFTAQGQAGVVLPELERAKLTGTPLQAFPYREDPTTWKAAFRHALDALGLSAATIGVEPTRLRVLELRYLEEAAPEAAFPDAAAVIAQLRLRKDEDEIAAMRQAVRIAEEAFRAALAHFRVGMTEQQLAAELVVQLLRHGSAPNLPFQPIVAAGPNGANPHATPTERPIQPGDLVIVDWGANHQGYFSDLTRTVAVGEGDTELEHIAAIVAQANEAGRAAVRPGLPAGQVDTAARQVIVEAGYGDFFIHRTGHGLGLEVHEPPFLYAENALPLEPGMTFTVEPGIYLPGRGGVRIEDDVAVTATGSETLSTLPRALWRLSA